MKKSVPVSLHPPKKPSPTEEEFMRRILALKDDGTLDKAAKLYGMAYITFSVANTYCEQANDLLEPHGIVQKKLKTAINNLTKAFDFYDKIMMSMIGGDKTTLNQICFDLDILNELLDAYRDNNIEIQRGAYYKAKLFLPEKNR